ncbi:vitellogenin [Nematostella vectensis]|uniref:vitellogenin n=1 Tax=Nematostella vectensis TaxID=45351 RepID=UPI002077604F|nr:vitellogenin [Nematostella vectensis]
MWKLLGILLLAALTQADKEHPWVGKRYIFQYQSDVIHKIPNEANKQIGLRVKCLALLDYLTNNKAQLKLKNINIHQLEVLADKETPTQIDAIPEAITELQRPVDADFSVGPSGLIKSVRAEREDPEWSLNIKRGILNLVQISPRTKHENSVFTVMENTLVGYCPVTYTTLNERERADANVTKVTKTIDYQRCLRRPEIKESIFFGRICNSCQKSLGFTPYLRQAGSIRYIFVNWKMVEVLAEEAHVVTPMSEFAGQIHAIVKQKLVLLSTKNKVAKPLMNTKKTGLSFRAVHPEEELRGFAQYQQGIQTRVKRLIEVLKTKQDLTTEDIPRMITEIITNVRLLKVPKQGPCFLTELIQTIFTEQRPKIRAILLDAFTIAGSDEVTFILKKMAVLKKLPIDVLNRTLFNIPFTPKVTLAHLTVVQELCDMDLLKTPEHFPIRRQCFLSLGALVNRITYQPEFKQRVDVQMKLSEIAKMLNDRLMKVKDIHEKIMYIKAIGNAGLRACQHVILAYLNFDKCTELRVESVWALRRLINEKNTKVTMTVLKHFINVTNHPEVRMACAVLLLDKAPTFHHMQVLVNTIKQEMKSYGQRSNQVASLVISKLSYMAYYNNLVLKDRAMCARLALRSVPYYSFGLSYSKAFRLAIFSDKFQTGLDLEFNKMNVPESFLPRNMNANLRMQFLGYHLNIAEVGARMEGLQDVIQDIVSEIKSRQKRSVWEFIWSGLSSNTEAPTTPTTNPSTEEMDEYSGTPDLPTTSTPHVSEKKISMFVKLFGQELKFTEITPKIVQEVSEQLIALLRGTKQTIETPLGDISITKNKISIKQDITKAFLPVHARQLVPTMCGMPLNMHLISSMVSDVTMDLQIEAQPSWWSFAKLDTLKTKLHVKPSISTFTLGQVNVHNPFVRVGVLVDNKMQMRPWLKIDMDYTPDKQYTWKIENPKTSQEVFVMAPHSKDPSIQGFCGIVEIMKFKEYSIERRHISLDIPRLHLTTIDPICFGDAFTGVERCITGVLPTLAALRLREVPVLSTLFRSEVHVVSTPTKDAAEFVTIQLKVKENSAQQMQIEGTFSSSGQTVKRDFPMNITFNYQTRQLIIEASPMRLPGYSPETFFKLTADLPELKTWDLEFLFGIKSMPYRVQIQGRIEPTNRRRLNLTCVWDKLPVYLTTFLKDWEPQLLYFLQTFSSVSHFNSTQGQSLEIVMELLSPLTALLKARTPVGFFQSKVMSLPVRINKLPGSLQDIRELAYAECRLSHQKLELFDNQSIKLNQDKPKCVQYVLAQDRNNEVFRVLAKRDQQNRLHLQVIVKITKQVIIKVSPDLTVTVNGKACEDKVCEVSGAARIVRREQRIKVQINYKLSSLHVVYMSNRIQVHANPFLQNRLRGLCGDMNGEQYDEFQSPTGEFLNNADQFQKAWRLTC